MKKNFGRLVWYDLNYGYQDCRLKWICALMVQLYFVNAAYQGCAGAEGNPGVVGYLTWLFRGMPEYAAVETGRFELPVPWLMLHACLLFLVGFYPVNDLTRSGGQAFVRWGRRRSWLLGKAVWTACTVAAYYGCLTVILALCALMTGGLVHSPEGMKFLYGISMDEIGRAELFLFWWAEPFLVSLALCLAEMALSLILEPMLALFFMLGYLTASVFWAAPALLGNYAMLRRQIFWSGKAAFSVSGCVTGCVLCSLAALAAGGLVISKKDIFP